MSVNDPNYDPETMIVDEQLRRIEVQTGGDLYVDFYERAFYEDVLTAARAAVVAATARGHVAQRRVSRGRYYDRWSSSP